MCLGPTAYRKLFSHKHLGWYERGFDPLARAGSVLGWGHPASDRALETAGRWGDPYAPLAHRDAGPECSRAMDDYPKYRSHLIPRIPAAGR